MAASAMQATGLPVRVFAGEYPLPSETFITTQAEGLRQRGWRVGIVTRRLHPAPSLALPTIDLLAGWRRLPVLSTISALGRLIGSGQLRMAARSVDPRRQGLRACKGHLPVLADALRSACPGPAIWLCHYGHNGEMMVRMRELGAITGPVVTIFHGFDVAKRLGDPAPPYELLRRHGDLFLPVSNRWRDALLSWGFPTERTVTCPLGIDCAEMARIEHRPSDRIRLFSICRLVEKKGVEYSLRAIASLEEPLRSQISLRVAGDGPLLRPLRQLADELGIAQAVEFLGAIAHARVPELLADSDIFILPSVTAGNGDMEGVPISLIESMAAGLPVISTLHSGIPELVTNGSDGILVAERDTVALARAIRQLATDEALRKRLGTAARTTAIGTRSLAGCTEHLHSVLSQVAENPSPGAA